MKGEASRLAAAMMIVIAMAMPAAALGGPPPGASSCQGCHPVAANDGPVLPLATFTAEQIMTAMQAFRSGTRPATVMDRVAKGFSDEEVQTIAQWYARAKTK
jgi:cytochrome subunit of sulfide dehydrogenase